MNKGFSLKFANKVQHSPFPLELGTESFKKLNRHTSRNQGCFMFKQKPHGTLAFYLYVYTEKSVCTKDEAYLRFIFVKYWQKSVATIYRRITIYHV